MASTISSRAGAMAPELTEELAAGALEWVRSATTRAASSSTT